MGTMFTMLLMLNVAVLLVCNRCRHLVEKSVVQKIGGTIANGMTGRAITQAGIDLGDILAIYLLESSADGLQEVLVV